MQCFWWKIKTMSIFEKLTLSERTTVGNGIQQSLHHPLSSTLSFLTFTSISLIIHSSCRNILLIRTEHLLRIFMRHLNRKTYSQTLKLWLHFFPKTFSSQTFSSDLFVNFWTLEKFIFTNFDLFNYFTLPYIIL